MIPVYQTKFGRLKGNCLQAAFASVLELPLEEVPNFSEWGPGKFWFDPTVEWLHSVGYGLVYFQCSDPVAALEVYGIACCTVVGETERHAQVVKFVRTEGEDSDKVYWEAKVVHDPNPHGGFEIGCIEEFLIPVKL